MKRSIILLVSPIILFSCSDDTIIREQENHNSSVEHARKWFVQNINTTPATSTHGRISSWPISISWEDGISYVKDKTATVEVPIRYEPNVTAYPQGISKSASYRNSTKLLLFNDGKDGYNVFIMRIMPDRASLSELEKNTYVKKTNAFTGDIIYYTWEGKPLVLARYENGKRTEWNYIEQTSKKDDTNSGRANGCYTIEVEWYSIACSAYGCGDPIYLYSDYYYYCSGGSSPSTAENADPGDLYGGGGGGGGGDGGNAENPISPEFVGDKPLFEYSNKCQGLQDIWNNFPNNEMYAYITGDGQLIVTNQLPFTGGAAFGTFLHPNGTTYYPYPMSQTAPTLNYAGMIQYPANNPTHYLIPVVASVHTHSPCRTDGTNGVSHPVGVDDKNFAAAHPELTHWVIGCHAIAQYTGTSNNFLNVLSGDISSTCSSIR
jgi:hypothetical protein